MSRQKYREKKMQNLQPKDEARVLVTLLHKMKAGDMVQDTGQ